MSRIWEIDFLRGTAIVLMVVFHIIYDLAEFYDYPFDYLHGFWFFIGRAAAILFLVLSGISSNFSANILKRSLLVLSAAALISAATYLFDSLYYIRFGILHLLGFCMLISIVLHRLGDKSAKAAAIIAGTASFLFPVGNLTFVSALFLPFGIMPPDFRSFDYYPLFPWAGFFFYGLALGKFLYGQKRTLLPLREKISSSLPVSALCFLGRHSLFIYLAHQPVIISFLFFIHLILIKN